MEWALKELTSAEKEEIDGRCSSCWNFAAKMEKDLSEAMDRLPQPVIGAVNGFAITGGFEIALSRVKDQVKDLGKPNELSESLLKFESKYYFKNKL